MKRFYVLSVCLSVLFLSCTFGDKTLAWDSEKIRYLDGDVIVKSSTNYKRLMGESGIIGAFSYNNGTISTWTFEDSKTEEARFMYEYVSTKTRYHYKGSYKLRIDDEGYFVVDTFRDSGGTASYRYSITDDILHLSEL